MNLSGSAPAVEQIGKSTAGGRPAEGAGTAGALFGGGRPGQGKEFGKTLARACGAGSGKAARASTPCRSQGLETGRPSGPAGEAAAGGNPKGESSDASGSIWDLPAGQSLLALLALLKQEVSSAERLAREDAVFGLPAGVDAKAADLAGFFGGLQAPGLGGGPGSRPGAGIRTADQGASGLAEELRKILEIAASEDKASADALLSGRGADAGRLRQDLMDRLLGILDGTRLPDPAAAGLEGKEAADGRLQALVHHLLRPAEKTAGRGDSVSTAGKAQFAGTADGGGKEPGIQLMDAASARGPGGRPVQAAQLLSGQDQPAQILSGGDPPANAESADKGRTSLAEQLEKLLKEAEGGRVRPSGANPGDAAGRINTAASVSADDGQSRGGAESGLRQILNELAGQSRDAGEAGSAKSGPDARPDARLDALLKAGANEKPGALQNAPGEAGARAAAAAGQAQPSGQGAEPAEGAGASMRQGAASFEKGLQSAEARIVGQVFVRLFSGARQGSGNMTINMHPPELGSVKVRIISDRGHLQVSLHPQNHQVVGILEKHLPTLQQSLADQGVDVSDLKVSVDAGGAEENPQFAEHPFHEKKQTASGSGPAAPEPDLGVAEEQPAKAAGEQGLSLRI